MSGIDVGTAFVVVRPDTTNFRALLQAQVNAAVAAVKVPALQATVATATTGTAAAATANTALAASNTEIAATATAAAAAEARLAADTAIAAQASLAEIAATKAVADALDRQVAAEVRLSAAITARADITKIASLQSSLASTAQAAQIAQLKLASLGEDAGKGFLSGAAGGNALRGSLIGLSRISPVAVFGLGAVGTAAIAAGLAIKSSISSAADFEQQLNTFQAVTQSTDAQMKQISSTAEALGNDLSLPGQSALDAAVGMTELAKAGLSVNDTLAASKGVLQLSTAASISAGQAAEITATQLNAFQLAGTEATRVAEGLADASIAAQGEITDFAAGFAQVGAVAQQAGVSFEDTTVLLTELAKAGLRGADGGTSLRTTLLRLVPTTKEAALFTKALGIEIDANKKIGDQIVPVIEQYRVALARLNPEQQTLALNQIFGQDAFRAASIIFGQQAGELERLRAEFEKTNSLQDLTEAKSRGLKGAWENLKSQSETLGLEVGGLATGPLTILVGVLSDTIGVAGDTVGALGKLEKAFADLEIPFVDTTGGRTLTEIFKRAFFITNVKDITDRIKSDGDNIQQALEEVRRNMEVFANKPPVNVFGGFDFSIAGGVDEDQQAAAKAAVAAPLTKAEKAARARIEALRQQEIQKAKQQIPIPLPLQQNQIIAQLDSNLNAELNADNAIVAFLRKKLNGLTEGTQKYVTVAAQLRDAQAQRDSVQQQIDSNAQTAANKQKQANEAAKSALLISIQNQQTRLQIAADAANNQGEAERRLIAFLAKEAKDTRLTTAQQLSFQSQLNAEREKQQQAIVGAAKAEIDRKKALFDLKIQIAETLTPNDTSDDQKAINAEIKFLQGLRDKTKRLSAEWIAYQSEIVALKGRLKNSSTSQGFTLAEFFQEAADEFNTFGSNVTATVAGGGILSGQDARGAVGGIALGNRDRLAAAQVSEQQRTNQILERGFTLVADAVTGKMKAVRTVNRPGGPVPIGTANAWNQAAWIQGS